MLRDAVITSRYQMRLALREPIWIVIAMAQPLLYLALYAPLLEPLARIKGLLPGSDPWQLFVPGILIQHGMFVGFGIIAEIRHGTIERMRVTPASRLGLLLGRTLRDALMLLVQATLLTVVAIAFGLHVPAIGTLLTVGLVLLLGVALSALSYAAGLWLKSGDALSAIRNMFILPVLLLSGILLPMTLAPRWLQRVSDANPFKHIVEAASAACAAALAVVGLVAVTRAFQRESA